MSQTDVILKFETHTPYLYSMSVWPNENHKNNIRTYLPRGLGTWRG